MLFQKNIDLSLASVCSLSLLKRWFAEPNQYFLATNKKVTIDLNDQHHSNSKNERPVSSSSACFGCETKTGVVGILVIFQDRPMFSHINGTLAQRPFKWCGTGLPWKRTKVRTTPVLVSHPKQVSFPKTGVLFLLWISKISETPYVQEFKKRIWFFYKILSLDDILACEVNFFPFKVRSNSSWTAILYCTSNLMLYLTLPSLICCPSMGS